MERNDVTSFMYFMWNMWSQEECEICFAEAMCGHKHIWEKWISACRRMDGPNGATEVFYAELDTTNQDILVAYATSKYNRRTRIR